MIWLIAKREIVTRAKSKAFLVLTGVLFAGVVGLALASAIFVGDDEAREVQIGVTGAGADFAPLLAAGSPEFAVTIVPNATEDMLLDGDVDVILSDTEMVWDGLSDFGLESYIQSVVQQERFTERAAAIDLSPTDIASLFEDSSLPSRSLDGEDRDFGVRIVVAGASGAATFILIQLWGTFVMMGVIEEKSTRVVEVLLSLVSARQLLAGKVLGLGLLALTQMLIFVGGVTLGVSLVSEIDVPTGVWRAIPLTLVTFILGFGFYSALYAAVGSTVSRQEDASTAQLPAMLPLLVGYMIAAASISEPDNPAVTIGSFIPFTAPVLLPFRTAFVNPPAWQILLSLAILAASIVLMLRFAGWIYRYSLLRIGSRVSYGDLWKNRSGEVLQ